MFSAPEKDQPSHHVLPRNPPQLHHKKPPAAHPIFQNHPQKHGQIDGFTPWRHIQIFSEIQTKFFEI
jgi:hypothetical protein